MIAEESIRIAATEPGISVELDRQTGAIEYIEDRLQRLALRIEPVLGPPGPESEPAGKAMSNSAMASRLCSANDRLQRIGRLLDDLGDRVDL